MGAGEAWLSCCPRLEGSLGWPSGWVARQQVGFCSLDWGPLALVATSEPSFLGRARSPAASGAAFLAVSTRRVDGTRDPASFHLV